MTVKNEFGDMTLPKEKLYGIYRGVTEDNADPLQAGRCRVRIFGIHSQSTTKEQTDGIPTAELPWAEPALNVVEGALTGFGLFAVPLVGSHVYVFFEQGNHMNPRYFAAVPGASDWGAGAGTYPHNLVLAVHGGHYIELDSSSGAERIKIYHKSGTLTEVVADGSITITGVNNETINISQNVSKTVGGTWVINVTGNTDLTSPQVTITGNLIVTGSIAADGAISSKSTVAALSDSTPVGLSTHTHTGVTDGNDTTDVGAG